jgi:uncharacterized protein
MRNTTLIFKPTDRCNAKCIYCSAYHPVDNRKMMTIPTLEKMFLRLEEWAATSTQLEEIKIIWHGGEPTLMPQEFFNRAIELEDRIRKTFQLPIQNLIQSNLLNLNQERVSLLKTLLTYGNGEMGRLGTSYDPFPNIRIAKSGDYNTIWERSIQLLEKENIPYGILFVVHKLALNNFDYIMDLFANRFPGIGIRFNPLYREGRARIGDKCRDLYITSGEWGDFLIRLYRHWEKLDKKPRWVPLKEFDDFHFSGSAHLSCDFSGRCATTHLGIDTDGTIYSCGRGIDREYEQYGNISKNSFQDIVLNPARQRMLNRTTYLHHTQCKECEWWHYCHGGCSMDAAIHHNNIYNKTNFCLSRKKFFNTIYKVPRNVD